jgi:hypothetical protein
MRLNEPARSLLVIAALLHANAASAEECKPPAPAGPDATWFYVQLVSTGDKPLPPRVWRQAYVAALPPEPESYSASLRTVDCYASSVLKRARRVKVRGQAYNYQSRVCDAEEKWRNYSGKTPFKCQLLPIKGGLFDSETPRKARDLGLPERQAALSEAAALIVQTPSAERAAVISDLLEVTGVRQGILARAVLSHVSSGECLKVDCLQKIQKTLEPKLRDWLLTSRKDLAAEEQRDEHVRALRAAGPRNKKLADDLLVILADPSQEAAYASDKDGRRRFENYVRIRLPEASAKAVLKIGGQNLDFSQAAAKLDDLNPPGRMKQ